MTQIKHLLEFASKLKKTERISETQLVYHELPPNDTCVGIFEGEDL